MLVERYGYIKETPGKGKGMFAKVFIPKGTIIVDPDEKICHKSEFDKLPEELKKEINIYGFSDRDGYVYKPVNNCKYMNHSCDSNVLNSGMDFDIVVRDIQKDEEMTIDYRRYYDSDLCEMFECKCGSKECCGMMRYELSVNNALRIKWLILLGEALKVCKELNEVS